MNNTTEKYSVTQYTVNSVLSFIDSGDIAIPEIPLFQKLTRSGYGRFGFNILDAKTRKPIRSITGIEASTKYTNWTILLLPFRSHDMPLQIREGAETHFDIDWQ